MRGLVVSAKRILLTRDEPAPNHVPTTAHPPLQAAMSLIIDLILSVRLFRSE